MHSTLLKGITPRNIKSDLAPTSRRLQMGGAQVQCWYSCCNNNNSMNNCNKMASIGNCKEVMQHLNAGNDDTTNKTKSVAIVVQVDRSRENEPVTIFCADEHDSFITDNQQRNDIVEYLRTIEAHRQAAVKQDDGYCHCSRSNGNAFTEGQGHAELCNRAVAPYHSGYPPESSTQTESTETCCFEKCLGAIVKLLGPAVASHVESQQQEQQAQEQQQEDTPCSRARKARVRFSDFPPKKAARKKPFRARACCAPKPRSKGDHVRRNTATMTEAKKGKCEGCQTEQKGNGYCEQFMQCLNKILSKDCGDSAVSDSGYQATQTQDEGTVIRSQNNKPPLSSSSNQWEELCSCMMSKLPTRKRGQEVSEESDDERLPCAPPRKRRPCCTDATTFRMPPKQCPQKQQDTKKRDRRKVPVRRRNTDQERDCPAPARSTMSRRASCG